MSAAHRTAAAPSRRGPAPPTAGDRDGHAGTAGSGRLGAAARLVVWIALLAGAVVVLHGLGRGDLAAPPLGTPGRWTAWWTQRSPVTATMAVLRLIALGAAVYLLAVTVAGAAAHLLRLRGLAGAIGSVNLPSLRRAVQLAAGLSFVASTSVSSLLAASAGASPPTPPAPVMRLLPAEVPPPPGAPVLRALPPAADAPAPVLRALPADDARTPVVMTAMPTDPPPGGRPADAPATVTLAKGDHLWGIAEKALSSNGRRPSDAEVRRYWKEVVAANASRLADPGNPDLVFAGQVMVLPPTAP